MTRIEKVGVGYEAPGLPEAAMRLPGAAKSAPWVKVAPLSGGLPGSLTFDRSATALRDSGGSTTFRDAGGRIIGREQPLSRFFLAGQRFVERHRVDLVGIEIRRAQL